MTNIIKNNRGFTLIEIVVVLILIGIVSAVVAVRVVDTTNQSNQLIRIAILKSHMRHAQSMAMNTGSVWGIEFQSSTYKLYKFDGAQQDFTLPGEDTVNVNMPDGITAAGYISFDTWGRPYTGVNNNTVINNTYKVGNRDDILITPNTGYIP